MFKIEKESEKWTKGICLHPEHNPPTHIVIQHGHIMHHKCPGCGRENHIKSQEYWC